MKYRAEIDGLRAIAVLPVVLYHADLEFTRAFFSGGFLGVDVFFVISGYLITSLILGETAEGRFSYLSFYERRARRLLPVLLLVSITVLPLGWWLMVPETFSELGGSVLSALVFVSNFFFLFQDSYAAESAHFKPFIHTWSLSVEEQFYLLYPACLLWITQSRRVSLEAFLIITGILSFALAVILTASSDDYSFFLFVTRIWELCAGAFLAAIEARKAPEQSSISPVLSGAGLALILLSFWLINDRMAEPGVHTIFAVLGAALVIRYTHGSDAVSRLLGSRPLVGCGLISYSLYLWHQPLLAFVRIYHFGEDRPAYIILAIGAAFLLSVLGYFLIEKPFRSRTRMPLRRFLTVIGLTSAAVALLGFAAWQGYAPPRAAQYGSAPTDGERYLNHYGAGNTTPGIIIVGDSHAAALGESFDSILRQHQLAATGMVSPGCPYWLQAVPADDSRECAERNQARLESILDSPARDIFIAGRYTSAIEGSTYTNASGIEETPDGPVITWIERDSTDTPATAERLGQLLFEDVSRLIRAGKRVYIAGPVPEMGIDPYRLWYKEPRGAGAVPASEPYGHFLSRNSVLLEVLARLSDAGAVVIYPHAFLCSEETGRCHSSLGGEWLYHDDDHLSRQGADRLVSQFMERYESMTPAADRGMP